MLLRHRRSFRILSLVCQILMPVHAVHDHPRYDLVFGPCIISLSELDLRTIATKTKL